VKCFFLALTWDYYISQFPTHLIDVAVGAGAYFLDELVLVLRISAGDVRAEQIGIVVVVGGGHLASFRIRLPLPFPLPVSRSSPSSGSLFARFFILSLRFALFSPLLLVFV